MTNYIEIISTHFPGVNCHVVGSVYEYSDIVWDGGDPLPSKAALDALTLVYDQELMWTKIKAYRDLREESGIIVTLNGTDYWFHSDVRSLIKYLFLLFLATIFSSQFPAGVNWKTMSDVEVPLTPMDIITVFQKVMAVGNTVFTIARMHKVAMLESPTPLTYNYKVANGNIPAWPPIYGE